MEEINGWKLSILDMTECLVHFTGPINPISFPVSQQAFVRPEEKGRLI